MKVEIYTNYSIGTVLSMIKNRSRNPEILYLNEVIQNYISDTKIRIWEAVQYLPDARPEVMKWIKQNVDSDIQYYVRCEYLDEPYNILKRKNGDWKRIADIGVTLSERASLKMMTDKEWMNILRNKAAKISQNPIMLLESHAHYDLDLYDGVRDELMDLLHDTGVAKCIIPAIEYGKIKRCMDLFDRSEYEWIYYAIGAHPKYIQKERRSWDETRWEEFRMLLHLSKCCAVGEIGLDYSSYEGFYDDDREFQKTMFAGLIHEANKAKLPVILHIRQSEANENGIADVHSDAIRILSENPIECGAILHCFGGNKELMERYMAVGVHYFGIGGRISYMQQELDEVIISMPESSIILETDSPYIRFSGDRLPNTSLTLYDVAKRIADMKGTTINQVVDAATENFKRLFQRIDYSHSSQSIS